MVLTFFLSGIDCVSATFFANDLGLLRDEGLAENWQDDVVHFAQFLKLATQFEWLPSVVKNLPRPIVNKITPDFSQLLSLREVSFISEENWKRKS